MCGSVCERERETWYSAIVSDVAVHVNISAVNVQVLHAAHKLVALHREILRQVRDSTQQQRPCEVQRPEDRKSNQEVFYK